MMNKSMEERVESIDKELKALRQEIRKDLERFSKVVWRIE